MREEFESMRHGHLDLTNVSKYQTHFFSDKIKPVYPALYWAGCTARQFADTEINEMPAEKAIELVSTGAAAHIAFSAMRDGSQHFSVDYGRLNSVAIRDSYLLSRRAECADSFGEGTLFSTWNATSRYWQIEINKHDSENTAVASHCMLYRFKKMPLGLNITLRTFKKRWTTSLHPYDASLLSNT